MSRKLMWPVLAVGLALLVAPFVISLPTNAAGGQRMMNSFQPIMQPSHVKTTAYYYDKVFVPLGKVTPAMSTKNVARFQGYVNGFRGVQVDAAKLVPMLGQALHMSNAQVQAMMGKRLPSMAAMLNNLPAMRKDFSGLIGLMQKNTGVFAQVNGGLAHYKPLVRTMQANVTNFRQVNSLPDFRLFTWFFVIPGLLLSLVAAYGLGAFKRVHLPVHFHHAAPTH